MLTCETPHAAGIRFALGAILDVGGWVLGPDPVSVVDVELDGRRTVAEIGIASPDVADAFPGEPHAGHARFHARVELAGERRGLATVAVRARDAAGREVTAHATVELQPFTGMPAANSLAEAAALGPLLFCDQPHMTGAGQMPAPGLLVGWAYAASAIERVLVVIDGRTSHEAVLGLWRGDVARELGRDDATESGWVLQLPPGACPPGDHEIAVVGIATDGRAMGLRANVSVLDRAAGAALVDHAEAGGDSPVPRERAPGELEVPGEHRAAVADVERLARYRWIAPLAAGASILDVGCGDGLGCEALQQAGAASLFGVDHDADALARAAARELRAARFAELGGAPLPCGDRSFDVVLAVGAPLDLAGLAAMMPELRRVMAGDGVLVVCGRGLAEALAREFLHVRVGHQRTGILSEVSGDDGAAGGTLETAEDDALELVACSHRPTRGLPPARAHGGPLAIEPWRALAATWTERALRAEGAVEATTIDAAWSQQHAHAMAIRLQESDRAREALERRVAEIELEHAAADRLTAAARRTAGRARAAVRRP